MIILPLLEVDLLANFCSPLLHQCTTPAKHLTPQLKKKALALYGWKRVKLSEKIPVFHPYSLLIPQWKPPLRSKPFKRGDDTQVRLSRKSIFLSRTRNWLHPPCLLDEISLTELFSFQRSTFRKEVCYTGLHFPDNWIEGNIMVFITLLHYGNR